MKILVIGNCSARKSLETINLTEQALSPRRVKNLLLKHEASKTKPAKELYLGLQNQTLLQAINQLRTINGLIVDHYIVSAGFGLVNENDQLPGYEYTFRGKSKSQIHLRSLALNLETQLAELISTKSYNLIYLALGKDYAHAIGTKWLRNITIPIITFISLPYANKITLLANQKTVEEYSKFVKVGGTFRFKGDLLALFANSIVKHKQSYDYLRKLIKDKVLLKQAFLITNLAPKTLTLDDF